ncbi:MAG TPA: ABC transporter substrate-binding protein [Syntrophales bacterium]|nr:ABC transporter substrate-binding protein [Syntrophales bacterium]
MKLKIFIMILFCLVSLGFQNTWGHAETPAERVRNILEEVMIIQTNPQHKGPIFRNQQRAAIKKIIGQNFYFDAMVKKALDTYWEKLNEAERADFKGIFQELFQDSYTKLVLDFLKREKILYTQEKLGHDQALIKTTLVRVNEEIPVDYSLALVQGQWLVEDVAIDGVSIVGNYQRSFIRVIKRESYESLLKKMRLQQRAIENPPQ